MGNPVLGGIGDEIISPFAWIGLGLVFINEIKALSNLKRYKRVRRALNKNGWDERIIEPMLYTWCSRYAARIAAIDEGFKSEIQQYYKNEEL